MNTVIQSDFGGPTVKNVVVDGTVLSACYGSVHVLIMLEHPCNYVGLHPAKACWSNLVAKKVVVAGAMPSIALFVTCVSESAHHFKNLGLRKFARSLFKVVRRLELGGRECM